MGASMAEEMVRREIKGGLGIPCILSLSLSYEGPSRSLTWIGVRCFCAGFRAASAFAFRERCLSLSLLNHMFPDSPSPIHDVLDD